VAGAGFGASDTREATDVPAGDCNSLATRNAVSGAQRSFREPSPSHRRASQDWRREELRIDGVRRGGAGEPDTATVDREGGETTYRNFRNAK
jgi:hypothetical protein